MDDSRDADPPPLIDAADALARAGGRVEVARELFALLRASVPRSAQALRDAHAGGDLERLREAAHHLLGATLYCGVPRARTQASEVERLCINGDRDGIERALPCLLHSLEALRECPDPLAAEDT